MYYRHKIKCLDCSLHYLCCSEFERFPQGGGALYCPECGSTGEKVRWVEEAEGYIFQLVGGSSHPAGISKDVWEQLKEFSRTGVLHESQ